MKSALGPFRPAVTISLLLLCFGWFSIVGSPVQGQQKPADDQYVIVPGVRVGAITAKTTLADLIRLYGKANVSTEDVPGPEGSTLPGATVFPNDPKKTLVIYWGEDKNKHNPERIQVAGETSLWKTDTGITLGTTLKEVEVINGKPFKISGFDWDYGGLVVEWNNGKLGGGKLGMGFDSGAGNQVTEKESSTVSGDRQLPSSHRVLQKMNPKVSMIECRF